MLEAHWRDFTSTPQHWTLQKKVSNLPWTTLYMYLWQNGQTHHGLLPLVLLLHHSCRRFIPTAASLLASLLSALLHRRCCSQRFCLLRCCCHVALIGVELFEASFARMQETFEKTRHGSQLAQLHSTSCQRQQSRICETHPNDRSGNHLPNERLSCRLWSLLNLHFRQCHNYGGWQPIRVFPLRALQTWTHNFLRGSFHLGYEQWWWWWWWWLIMMLLTWIHDKQSSWWWRWWLWCWWC